MIKTKEEIVVENGNKDLDADLILSMMEEYSQSQLSEYKEKLKESLANPFQKALKENEELKLKLSGKTFFDEKEVLESQLDKAKEKIEFLEMQVKSLQGKNRTEPPF